MEVVGSLIHYDMLDNPADLTLARNGEGGIWREVFGWRYLAGGIWREVFGGRISLELSNTLIFGSLLFVDMAIAITC